MIKSIFEILGVIGLVLGFHVIIFKILPQKDCEKVMETVFTVCRSRQPRKRAKSCCGR